MIPRIHPRYFSRRSFSRRSFSRRTCLVASLLPVLATRRALSTNAEGVEDLYVPDRIDRSIERGIDALLRQQQDDGSIADRGHATAMTSLAIMALAAVGIVADQKTRRGLALHRAIEYVLNPRNQDGGYFGQRDGSRMYGHGITTLMLTEILGMGSTIEQNRRIHDSLTEALKIILKSQAVVKPPKLQGGWRYTPSAQDSDLSVSVWQVMALRSAKNDGLDVPLEAIEQAVDYLINSFVSPLNENGQPRDQVSGFAYTPGTHHPSFTMTAAGLLAMQTCGQYDSPLVAAAARWLLQHTPNRGDRYFFYGMYYYAQGMHQVGGEAAEVAAKVTSDELLELQSDAGHWISEHGEERNIGMVYSTALAILSLGVRYHYLPIYQR